MGTARDVWCTCPLACGTLPCRAVKYSAAFAILSWLFRVPRFTNSTESMQS